MPTPISYNLNEILALQFDQPSKKRKPEYGLSIAKAVWSKPAEGVNENYFLKRNKVWKENADFAKGNLSKQEFLDKMGVKNEQSYLNLDWTLLKVMPRYKKTIVGGFMNREEKPSVRATDILSKQLKQESRIVAEYVLKQRQDIEEMEAAGGFPLEDENRFEDLDALELHYEIDFHLPDEMMFEEFLTEILDNSDYEDLKRQLLGDLIDYNHGVTKIETIDNGSKSPALRFRVKRCLPSRVIYNVFESPVGRDVSFIGEGYPVAIAELRRTNPKITEKQWFEIASKIVANSAGFSSYSWNDNYLNSASRPYDNQKVMVLDFEVKVIDKDYYVKTTNQFDKEIIVPKKGKPNPQNGEAIEEDKFNMYCGLWVIDTEFMLKWEVAPNMIRPYQNGIDCFSNYSIVCPDNDGTLIPSLIERGIPCVKRLIDTSLKLQQMTITMAPDQVIVDVEGLQNVDVGTGGLLDPLELKRIADQTGRLYWSSAGSSGVQGDQNPIPYQQLPSGHNVAQINMLINLYNFWLARLNDEWGTNPDAMGQPVPSRRSNGVNQNMIQAANNAIEYIYDGFVNLLQQTGSKIAMKMWDTILFEAIEYKQLMGTPRELIDTAFDVNIEMIPVDENKQRLQQKIDIALEKGLISLGQAIRLENINNIKKAELYLIKLEKKSQQQAAEREQSLVKMNAQVQQQSADAKRDNDIQVQQSETEAKMIIEKATHDHAMMQELAAMVRELNVERMKTGKEIPAELQPIVNMILALNLQRDAAENQPPQEEVPQEEMIPEEMAA